MSMMGALGVPLGTVVLKHARIQMQSTYARTHVRTTVTPNTCTRTRCNLHAQFNRPFIFIARVNNVNAAMTHAFAMISKTRHCKGRGAAASCRWRQQKQREARRGC